jgi:hypothetical protein
MTTGQTNEVTILVRLLSHGQPDLTPKLARHYLGLQFSEADKARMHELALKNQQGLTTAEERDELRGYAKAGCLLGILQSKARKVLKKTGQRRSS